jgi:hypothetical protein
MALTRPDILGAFLTLALCAICWLLFERGIHAIEWIGLGYLEFFARPLEIFAFLSIADAAIEKLMPLIRAPSAH